MKCDHFDFCVNAKKKGLSYLHCTVFFLERYLEYPEIIVASGMGTA